MVTFRATGPAVSEATVSEFEASVGATLPDDYREFLKHTNGGVPEPSYVPEPADLGISARGFFSLGIPEGDLSMSRALSTWDGRYPDKYLPIVFCEGSNLLLLGVHEATRGQVVYWDHDAEAEDGEPPRTDNLTPVASSFTALLDSMTDDDPDEAAVQALLDGGTGWVKPGFKPKFS